MKEDETKRHVYSFEGTEDFRLPRGTATGNKVGAEYTLNLRLKTDFSQASQTDDLNYTINYAEVFKAVKEEMKIPSRLLEHVIQRIAGRLFHDFPQITEIKIALFKQNPPMGAECQETGVESIYTKD